MFGLRKKGLALRRQRSGVPGAPDRRATLGGRVRQGDRRGTRPLFASPRDDARPAPLQATSGSCYECPPRASSARSRLRTCRPWPRTRG
jgi:hypothetical protein